ncbi:homeobox-leucine zipper protein hat5 [Phtheirospermum japonicum]|uniref:Homeobox-leucine zipper protein n=1 Tax=Phtheirospermum japonicum TaxID=374723 RepID=A0A830B658_9LAMI|nr:homeobox-leucine zipper protein hat5 [Phtheirospermum japonicum]
MEGCSVYDDSHIPNVLLKNENSQVLDSIWAPNSSPSFHASASMVNFEDAHNSQRQFVEHLDCRVENQSDEPDGCFHQPDKKRRLMPNQVQFLEKSFEVDNKLEPDRKIQLAKELGLQPRQVSIWFQNRRARCKTKVLEKEYNSLKSSYDKLKEDYETLSAENEKLKNEVHQLTHKLIPKDSGKPKSKPEPTNGASDVVPEAGYKQDEAASSAKSDVFDSDSPHYGSDVLEHDLSDFSQDLDEDESLRRTLLPFPKIEVECYDDYDDLQPNSCNLGFPAQDQGTWFWQY